MAPVASPSKEGGGEGWRNLLTPPSPLDRAPRDEGASCYGSVASDTFEGRGGGGVGIVSTGGIYGPRGGTHSNFYAGRPTQEEGTAYHGAEVVPIETSKSSNIIDIVEV